MDKGTDSGMLGSLSGTEEKNLCNRSEDKGWGFAFMTMFKEIIFFLIRNIFNRANVQISSTLGFRDSASGSRGFSTIFTVQESVLGPPHLSSPWSPVTTLSSHLPSPPPRTFCPRPSSPGPCPLSALSCQEWDIGNNSISRQKSLWYKSWKLHFQKNI